MPFVYTRDEDNQIMGVFENQQTIPEGHSEHEESWDNSAPWTRFIIIRNGVGDYYNTGVPHPDENDGLMVGDPE